jgi:hypothetical protein
MAADGEMGLEDRGLTGGELNPGWDGSFDGPGVRADGFPALAAMAP